MHGRRTTYRYWGCRCDDCTDANTGYAISNRRRSTELLAMGLAVVPREAHGKASTYNNHGCRCGPCVTAHSAECLRMKRGRAERLAADPSLVEHGTENAYNNWGCRCDMCRNVAVAARRWR